MTEYFLGHSEIELERLMVQDEVLRPITERLLRSAGLIQGMRVLDIGCGAGDMSMQLAKLVGPDSMVVGVDFASSALESAVARAARRGLSNVVFVHADLADFADPQPFDFVVGRYVLVHQADPASFIRMAASHLHPGGVLAFHEVDCQTNFESCPPVPLADELAAEVERIVRPTLLSIDAPRRLIALFAEAGLAAPTLFCERLVGGGTAIPALRYIAATLAAIRALTRPTESAVDVEKLTMELVEATTASRSQYVFSPQYCVWTTI